MNSRMQLAIAALLAAVAGSIFVANLGRPVWRAVTAANAPAPPHAAQPPASLNIDLAQLLRLLKENPVEVRTRKTPQGSTLSISAGGPAAAALSPPPARAMEEQPAPSSQAQSSHAAEQPPGEPPAEDPRTAALAEAASIRFPPPFSAAREPLEVPPPRTDYPLEPAVPPARAAPRASSKPAPAAMPAATVRRSR